MGLVLIPLLSAHLDAILVRLAPWIFGSLLCVFVVVPVVRWFRIWKALRPIPGPWDLIPFWFTISIIRKSLAKGVEVKDATALFFGIVREVCDTYKGKTFKAYIGISPTVVIHSPEAAETLLSSTGNHGKTFEYSFLTSWLGPRNILTATGDIWRFKRKLLTPAFHFRVLENYMQIFNENGDQLTKRIGALLDEAPKEAIPLFHNVQKCALDIIGQVTMGTKLRLQENKNENFRIWFNRLTFLISVRCFRPWTWLQTIYEMTTEGRVFKETLHNMEAFSYSVMRNRGDKVKDLEVISKLEPEDNINHASERDSTLLDALLKRHLQENRYELEEVKKDIDTILFAGNDSTTSAISWNLYMLGLHPEIQAKVHHELDQIFDGDIDRDITTNDLKQMKYLECCLKESMRLFPPIPLIGRVLDHELVIDGHTIPAGVRCFVSIFSLHRNPDCYKDPDSFVPERFMSQEIMNRHPFSYIPFSGGPKNCLGQRFAMLEVKLLLAKVLLKYAIEPTWPLEKLKITYEVILKARGGLRIHIRRRGLDAPISLH
ncbi:cytochrome P450 4V2 [Ixodes scapularis]